MFVNILRHQQIHIACHKHLKVKRREIAHFGLFQRFGRVVAEICHSNDITALT